MKSIDTMVKYIIQGVATVPSLFTPAPTILEGELNYFRMYVLGTDGKYHVFSFLYNDTDLFIPTSETLMLTGFIKEPIPRDGATIAEKVTLNQKIYNSFQDVEKDEIKHADLELAMFFKELKSDIEGQLRKTPLENIMLGDIKVSLKPNLSVVINYMYKGQIMLPIFGVLGYGLLLPNNLTDEEISDCNKLNKKVKEMMPLCKL